MKKLYIFYFSLLGLNGVLYASDYMINSTDVFVNSYTKSDGTFVNEHYRSYPDGIKSNNYSSSSDILLNLGDYGNTNVNYAAPFTLYAYGIFKNETKSCNRRFPGTAYNLYTQKCDCTNGNTFNERLKSCKSDLEACNEKFPGTIYQKEGDKCVCENGGDYDKKSKRCLTKNESCSSQLPGSIYDSNSQKCVCINGEEIDEKTKKCSTGKNVCEYMNGKKGKEGDLSSNGMICNAKLNWECKTGTVYYKELNKCIAKGQYDCKIKYGEYSYNDVNGNCICRLGHPLKEGKCTVELILN